jgi:V8-like Glu-specific endopeptidase
MKFILTGVLFGLIFLLPCAPKTYAQKPFIIERQKTIAKNSRTEPRSIRLSLESGIGKVAEYPFPRPGTSNFRLHFLVNAAPEQPTWEIRIVEDNVSRRLLWSYSPVEEKESDFWSIALRSSVRIEVYSTQENSQLQLLIDKIIVEITPAKDAAITFPDQRKDLKDQSEPTRKLGKSVARIRFVNQEDGEWSLCTGFLLAADLMMTNHHCIKTEREARTAEFDFDYDEKEGPSLMIKGKALIAWDPVLDFSIVKLRKALNDRTPLQLSAEIPTNISEFLLIEHPLGEQKQVSILDCRMKKNNVEGLSERLTDFTHGCDTLKGSSGSPILNIQTRKVIGLHHLGFAEGERNLDKPTLINQAVRIEEIIKFISGSKEEALKAALGIPLR